MAYAKTHLASLIREAIAGEEIVIARDEQPLVRLVPVEPDTSQERVPGDLMGKLSLPDEFFLPLADADVDDWER